MLKYQETTLSYSNLPAQKTGSTVYTLGIRLTKQTSRGSGELKFKYERLGTMVTHVGIITITAKE